MVDEMDQYLDHFDQRRVEIRFVSTPDTLPDAIWYAEWTPTDGEQQDRDAVVRELESALTQEGPPVPHTLDVRRSYFDWGASAGAEEVLVQVANFLLEHGKEAMGDAIKAGMGAGIYALWNGWKGRAKPTGERTWERNAAEAKAREVVARAYGMREESLELMSEGHNEPERRWSFEFEDDDVAYSVTLSELADSLVTVEVGRRLRG